MHARTEIILILLLCLTAGIFIAGCTQQAPAPTTPAQPTPQVTAGMANPASVSCIGSGGTLEIKNNADGSQYGMCTFQNGTSCEEWALFRNEGCKPAGEPLAK
jgi:putative hemolysin